MGTLFHALVLLSIVTTIDALARGMYVEFNYICEVQSEDQIRPLDVDCTGFIQCSGTTAYWHTCAKDMFFDGVVSCSGDSSNCPDLAAAAANRCPIIQRLKFPHPESCTMFYNCEQTTARGPFLIYEDECPFPKFFDTDTRQCLDPKTNNVTCQAPKPIDQCSYRSECGNPSCTGLPNGPNAYTNQPFDVEYVICNGGNVQSKEICKTPGQIFDPIQKICTADYSGSIGAFCQQNPNTVFADPALCSTFYNCSAINATNNSKMKPYQDECPYRFLFDQIKQTCLYYDKVMCGLRTEPLAPCDYIIGDCNRRETCLSCEESCVGLKNGDNIYPGRALTNQYLVCIDERTINIKECPSGQLFEPVSRLCAREIGVDALDNFCSSNPNMVIAHPGECSQFYDCSQLSSSGKFHKYLRECYYPELYDPVTNQCKQHNMVNCEFRTKPATMCDYLQYQCVGTTCAACPSTMPDCTGQPDGFYALIGEEMTANYIQCRGGYFESVLQCAQGQIFDKFSKTCADTVSQAALSAYCNENPGATVANPKHCGQYYKCPDAAGGTAPLMECPYPNEFSISAKVCRTYETVDCSERFEKLTPCEYLTANPCSAGAGPCTCILPSCTGKPDGFVDQYPGNANKYYRCRDQRTFVTDCTPLPFDPVSGRCQGAPPETTTPPQPTTSPTTSEPTTSEPTTPSTTPGIEPRTELQDAVTQCTADATLIAIPHSQNCHWFFNCSDLSGVSECFYPYLFDTTSERCVEYSLANCLGANQPQKMCDYDQFRSEFETCQPETTCAACELHYPSCIGKPNNYQEGLPIDQTKYYECRDNRTTVYSCDPGLVYDGTSCAPPSAVPDEASTIMEASGYCVSDPTSIIPHRDNCAEYYTCDNGNIATERQCNYPQLFDVGLRACADSVVCGARAEVKTACSYKNILANYPGCIEGAVCTQCDMDYPSCVGKVDGTKGTVPSSPNSFYVCRNERTFIEQCPQSQTFNPTTSQCAFDASSAMASSVQEASQVCALDQTAKIPHVNNCARYFICNNTKTAVELECSYPELFDAATKVCALTVNCGSRPEFKEPCAYLSVLDRYPYCDPGMPCSDCEQDHPSCVGKVDNFKGPILPDPSSYYKCLNERTYILECSVIGNVFLPNLNDCGPDPTSPIIPLEPANVAIECAQYRTNVYPMVGSCARYYDCRVGSNGHLGPFVAQCEYPYLFDEFDGRCTEPTTARCGSRKIEVDRCEYLTIRRQYCTTPGPCVICEAENPSCRGKPDAFIGGIPINGAKFYTCLNQRTTIGTCPNNQIFNSGLGGCEASGIPPPTPTTPPPGLLILGPNQIQSFCMANPTGVAAHPDSCAQYWNCSTSRPGEAVMFFQNYLQECRYPFFFNRITGTCDNFNAVDCGTRKEVITPCEFIAFTKALCNNLTSCAFCENVQLSCRGKADGYKDAMPLNANQYFECQNQRTTIGTCPTGQTFDSVLAVCKVPTQPTIPVMNTSMDAEPYCAQNASAKFPHAKNCAQYFDCSIQNGPYGRFLGECIYPDLYDPPSGSCQDHSLVACGKRYEPRLRCEYFAILTQYCRILGTNCQECDAENPSCIAQIDGLKGAIPNSRTEYYTCSKERTIISRCQNTYEFDVASRKCIPLKLLSSSAEAEVHCRTNPNGIYPSTVSCAQYFDCKQTTFGRFGRYLKECAYPNVFDIDTRTCKRPGLVTCGIRPELKNPCEYMANMETYTGKPCTLPSCVGKINGLHHYPGMELQQKFIQCRDNRLVSVQTCEANKYFDPVNKNCRIALTQSAVNFYCNLYPNTRASNPLNCAQYINCNPTQPQLIECGYPRLFNGTSCQSPETVTCGSRFEPVAPCEYAQNKPCPANQPNCAPCEERIPSCVGLADGDNPYPRLPPSSLFVRCKNNRTISVIKCRSDLFNPVTRSCGGNFTRAYINNMCDRYPTGQFADPSWCSRYYDCSKPFDGYLGIAYLRECKYPELYSTDSNSCVNIFRDASTSVSCGLRFEPKDACNYFEHCGFANYPNCPNCTQLLPSCIGREDRRYYNYFDDPYNNQYFACLRERTVLYGRCLPSQRYDTLNNACLSNQIPLNTIITTTPRPNVIPG